MNADLLNELKQHVGEFEGRLMWLEDSLADLGYGSHADGNAVTVYNDNEKEIATIEIEFVGNDGSDEIKVSGIEVR